jgi:DNA-binding SARP family transcriptional activator
VPGLRVEVLGPVELMYDDNVVDVPGPKQRAVIAALATAPGRAVSIDALLDAVWGEDLPDGVQHSLQQHVSALRKAVAAAGHPDPATAIARKGPAYALVVDGADSDDFERDASTAIAAGQRRDWSDASTVSASALAYWRGDAFADTRDAFLVQAAAARLDSMRVTVLETRFEAMLALGRAAEVLPQIRETVAMHPLHEQFRYELMLALYRSGRQADALAAYQSARNALVDQLGIEPGPALRGLEQAILEHSPELDLASANIPASVYATIKEHDAGRPARLECADGQVAFLTDDTALIGRDADARVHLLDGRVSRRHAEVVRSGSDYVVRDLGSTNGTSVNGRSVDETALVHGDIISIGGVELRFLDPSIAPRPHPPDESPI